MHTVSQTRPIRANSYAALAAGLAFRVFRTVKKWWRLYRNRQVALSLVELDDHMLEDIGLNRGDVRSAIALPVTIDPTTRLKVLAVIRRAETVDGSTNRARPLVPIVPDRKNMV